MGYVMYFLHRLSVHINITKIYHAGGRQSEKQSFLSFLIMTQKIHQPPTVSFRCWKKAAGPFCHMTPERSSDVMQSINVIVHWPW